MSKREFFSTDRKPIEKLGRMQKMMKRNEK